MMMIIRVHHQITKKIAIPWKRNHIIEAVVVIAVVVVVDQIAENPPQNKLKCPLLMAHYYPIRSLLLSKRRV